MVFPSIPIYADPSNWNQQQQPHHGSLHTNNIINSTARPDHDAIIQLPPIAPILPDHNPTSLTADRSRPTRYPHPESGLNCPRCNSTNTKFCYFNNYSLSQPRHFCRSCRRYWTRGGTLRNVPVGGGSRRNGKRQNKQPSSANATSHSTGKINNQPLINSIVNNINRSDVVQMQFRPIPFATTFESNSHVLPVVQLGASGYSQSLGLGSRNEELLGVFGNATGTDLGINGGGSQGMLANFDLSSNGNVIQQRSLFN